MEEECRKARLGVEGELTSVVTVAGGGESVTSRRGGGVCRGGWRDRQTEPPGKAGRFGQRLREIGYSGRGLTGRP